MILMYFIFEFTAACINKQSHINDNKSTEFTYF